MEGTPRKDETTENASIVLAIAMVLPVLGIVVYGFEIGWTALGVGSAAAMAVVALIYYLLLRVMLRYRRR
jgi:membrane protein YdbS with pleckstrin-like domain